jgi:methylthioribose-1-phosphate isomerase
MASSLMKKGLVDAVLVGCDRVAANGDAANKIGTSGVAILAKHYGIPFYVLGPTSTIDMECATGGDIEIEERKASEVTDLWYTKRMAPEGVKVYNPAFDVTDRSLITGIITQHGVAKAPFTDTFRRWLASENR